jgi:hypothetical protein
MKIVEPTFELLPTGEVVPDGIEPGACFWCRPDVWLDDGLATILKNCAWPNRLKQIGWKESTGYLISVEQETEQ